MPHFTEIRVVPYTASQMFDLVADMESYPHFLPWCRAARIVSRAGNTQKVDLTIGYMWATQTFRSHVTLSRPDSIRVDYGGGSMKHLDASWTFHPLDSVASEVSFNVDFSFGSRLLQQTVEGVFGKAASRMIQAFYDRAVHLYGQPKRQGVSR